MEKQTAVDWLVNNLPTDFKIELIKRNIFQLAKKREKQQVINAFNDGYRSGHFDDGKLGSKYYQEYF